MKKLIIPLFAIALFTSSCDIDKKGKTELPEVDVEVDVEEGNLPEFDVDWADVDISTTTKMVEVPKVVVVMEEEEIEVPTIDIDMPDDTEKYEQELIVEAEVEDVEHEIKIQEIRATNNRLYVIASLTALESTLGDKTLRVQDQVSLNAPDLDVKYIVIGEKPDRIFNNNNMYVASMNDLPATVKDAEVIYKR
ncbi:MAG TPA: hypothetical protein EYN07_13895 [Flavobacteriaceae bacterium]|jgi:hypothetical protein|nr:hypothetical protein [Flavobacteriaceae bacterium]MAM30168.1 hypothetical protein [Flavobacteriaceae bacterium]MAY54166.1 hypothetical protein [Flavobacteriaceae bacterium]HBR53157.1 hypothetical protein [Flavobacteriaceae bacterium]HIB49286.1 hypothetical protein [Flavobacteriaceae bacterium]|tara:strand:- start:31443 stop:32021 length:579 start_codon:yes stop_codon:yes gene_type:complete